MSTKICQLKHGSSNVIIEGVVRRKSELNDGASSKYFFFHLYDAESIFIRVAAFKDVAVALFDKFENGKSYRLSKVSASNNCYRGETSLQIILTKSVEITPIEDISSATMIMTALSKVPNLAKGTNVNVIGRLVQYIEKDVVLSQGHSSVLIATLMEKNYHIDATFWEHKELIIAIPPDEISLTIILIEGAIVSVYKDSVSVSVGKSSVVKINPEHEACAELRKLSCDSFYINLSQQASSQGSNQPEYSPSKITAAIKRDLSEIEDELQNMEEKQERLKIRKLLLIKELSKYE